MYKLLIDGNIYIINVNNTNNLIWISDEIYDEEVIYRRN